MTKYITPSNSLSFSVISLQTVHNIYAATNSVMNMWPTKQYLYICGVMNIRTVCTVNDITENDNDFDGVIYVVIYLFKFCVWFLTKYVVNCGINCLPDFSVVCSYNSLLVGENVENIGLMR